MKPLLLSAIALALVGTGPAFAQPWAHPDAAFGLDIPAGWEERTSSRTSTMAVFTPSPSFLANMVCTVTASALTGPPATPAGWRMPDQVLADPAAILTRGGDSLSRLIGSRKFNGADGFPGWQVWADVVKPGAAAPYFKQFSHVLSGPNMQLTAVCITPSSVRASLSAKTIEESLALGASLRDAR